MQICAVANTQVKCFSPSRLPMCVIAQTFPRTAAILPSRCTALKRCVQNSSASAGQRSGNFINRFLDKYLEKYMKLAKNKLARSSGKLSLIALAVLASSFALADDSGWYAGANVGKSRGTID